MKESLPFRGTYWNIHGQNDTIFSICFKIMWEGRKWWSIDKTRLAMNCQIVETGFILLSRNSSYSLLSFCICSKIFIIKNKKCWWARIQFLSACMLKRSLFRILRLMALSKEELSTQVKWYEKYIISPYNMYISWYEKGFFMHMIQLSWLHF